MEWVEVTAKTIDAAKESALDHLGVDESLAEFDIVDEPKKGLFGRIKVEARVRARVRPTQPRPKADRRRRRGPESSGKGGGGKNKGRSGRRDNRSANDRKRQNKPKPAKDHEAGSTAPSGGGRAKAEKSSRPKTTDNKTKDNKSAAPTTSATPAKEADVPSPSRPSRGGKAKQPKTAVIAGAAGAAAVAATAATSTKNHTGPAPSETGKKSTATGEVMQEDVTVEEQADIVWGFLEGLLDAFDVDGEITQTTIDDETVELSVLGEDLGLLIGPKGNTLQAIQELSRTAVQRQVVSAPGRVRLDVAQYRMKRREALARFVTVQAEETREAGVQRGLEPMNAADRKVVHDTVNEIDGVHTISEGQDPSRRVVIIPDGE